MTRLKEYERWEPAEETDGEPLICLRCGKQTEALICDPTGGPEMVLGERCRPCGWVIRFDGEGE